MQVQEMRIELYDEVCELWSSCEGVGFDESIDTKERLQVLLMRSPGLSFVAIDKGKVVGAVLAGHDGFRGSIYRLAVAENYRNKGVGKDLVENVIKKLRAKGIPQCNTWAFTDNEQGPQFWKIIGWKERPKLKPISKDITL